MDLGKPVRWRIDRANGTASPEAPSICPSFNPARSSISAMPTRCRATAGSLDDALRSATFGLSQWLMQDYGLSLSEVAQVLGSSVQYGVANLAGRSVGVAAKLDKTRLAALVPVAKERSPRRNPR